MTVTDDQHAARVADAAQAAYFRDELDAERQLLLRDIEKRWEVAGRLNDAGGRRIRQAIHTAEAQVRYLDRLIGRLDGRFGTGHADRPSDT